MEKEQTKITIKAKDENGCEVSGEGYIIKQLNKKTFEVWSENLNSVIIIGGKDFSLSEN
jgi:hypothetical protein